jgi:hypothetical protein
MKTLLIIFCLLSFSLQNKETKMKVTIGSKVFIATLVDNEATRELKKLLPMTVKMTELNGNEKYFHLADDLPTSDAKAGTIQSGDILLYSGNSLVLFYETFSSSYSYTKIGRIENISGLKQSLGTGNVSVKFEIE